MKQSPSTPSAQKTRTVKNSAVSSDQSTRCAQLDFTVVGIGASAGGLDAFKRFLINMPGDSGLAIVLVQHLDPTHESLTAELLAKHTTMKVIQVTDRMTIEPNHVYVIPPNKSLTISDGTLFLTPPVERRGLRTPIDFFFRSLADTQLGNAIGIVLSGTGSDGTLGLGAIKANGGMVMVQTPDTSQYDGMPRSAIASGLVDYVLDIEDMPAKILHFVTHVSKGAILQSEPLSAQDEKHIDTILSLLQTQGQHDFRSYKKGTVTRRIDRRVSLHQLDKLADYVQLLRDNPDEVAKLSHDLLIGVTRFFREPEAFKILQDEILPKLVDSLNEGEPFRAWVPSCATGEEAYSLGMLLAEQLEAAGKSNLVQIFATDIDENALAIGRDGIYPESIVNEVSADRLQRFFRHTDQTYRVGDQLRKLVVFATQNLISDPPFSSLHFISCRNFMIYLEPAMQAKVIPLFHFSLMAGGYLFLGNTETVGQHGDLFEAVARKWRIYRRTGPARPDRVEFPISPGTRKQPVSTYSPVVTQPANLGTLVQEQLLEDYVPAAVLTTRAHEILFFNGKTDNYLKQPSGRPTHSLLDLAAASLRGKLRAAITQAVETKQSVTLSNVRIKRQKRIVLTQIIVKPLTSPTAVKGLLLITFGDEPSVGKVRIYDTPNNSPNDSIVHQLEHELKITRDELQHTIEDMEASNEELKASNEEMMSMNEELQSTNEELETSKEELQSLNEELTTVNNQLQEKVGELWLANNDLANLISSTDIATLFLDEMLHIKRFTPVTTTVFSLIPADIGRPIQDLAHQFVDKGSLEADARQVLEGLLPLEKERTTKSGTWYIQRISPYRTQDSRIQGVAVTFTDVTQLKNAQEKSECARIFAANIIDTIHEPLLVLDASLRVVTASQSFYDIFQLLSAQTEGQLIYELDKHQWDIPKLRIELEDVIAHKGVFQGFELTHDFPAIGQRTLVLNGRLVKGASNAPDQILLAIEDITERKQANGALRKEKEYAQVTLNSIGDGVISVDAEGFIMYLNPVAEKLTGCQAANAVGQQLASVFHLLHEGQSKKRVDPFKKIVEEQTTNSKASNSNVLVDSNRHRYFIQYTASVIPASEGRPQGMILVFRDVSEARRATQKITHQASHDAMTGLVNRMEFEHRLQQLLEMTKKKPSEHALCYMDLDQFKIINDTCGHAAGDELLREISGILQSHVRRQDTLARLGGDEFGVLMVHCTLNQAKHVAKILCAAIDKYPFQWEGKSFTVGVSIGVVAINEDSGSVMAVLKAADSACYAAKDDGRNRIHVFREDDVDTMKRHGEMQWATQIGQALEQNRFRLNCQKITPTQASGDEKYYEILLEMLTEDGNRIVPDAFFPAAERFNLCSRLDHWVVHASLNWLAKHSAIMKHVDLFSINLSGQSLGDEDFLEFLVKEISSSQISPNKLCFEVTETATIANMGKAIEFITELKTLGCRFALDDFGSGLSSFRYLKTLPVDFLKIDGLFVRDIIDDPVQLALVKSINDIGHEMGKKTIAEYVESKDILEKIKEIGIDYAQGYGVGRPHPLNELEKENNILTV